MRPLRAGGQLKENRRHARVHARVRCWCEGDNVTLYTRVGNVSEGGIFLRTSTPMAPGSRTHLRLELGGAEPCEADATVVWARGAGDVGPPGMGLMFVGLGA